MCGIAGIASRSRLDVGRAHALVQRMLMAQHHRGPEGMSVHSMDRCMLGHCRLSFQSIGSNTQPYVTRSGHIVISFNGEVFNIESLRTKYATQISLHTSADSELIGELYELLGNSLFKELDGMFAIAVFDCRRQSLVLARDRLGKKPLAYAMDGDRLVFASEISAIQHANPNYRLSLQGTAAFLAYNSIPAPLSMLKGVTKVRPGHCLEFQPSGTTEQAYWTMSTLSASYDVGAAIGRRLAGLLKDATCRRLQDNVRYGVLLSGGLDSSLVASVASRAVKASALPCFSASFPSVKRYDESRFARRAAGLLGCPHIVVPVEPQSFRDATEVVLSRIDEPNADSSLVPQFMVTKAASATVKVLLTGDGADEFWLGYKAFAWQQYCGNALGRSLIGFLARLAALASSRRSGDIYKVLAASKEEKPELRFYRALTSQNLLHFPLLVDDEQLKTEISEFVNSGKPDSDVQRLQFGMIAVFLRSGILQKLDQTSMLNSVEVRSPFLDNEVVDYSLRIPSREKSSIRRLKIRVRQAASSFLPRALAMQKKVGFRSPLGSLLRSPAMREYLSDNLLRDSSPIVNLITRAKLEQLIKEHNERQSDNSRILWASLCLCVWMQARGIGCE